MAYISHQPIQQFSQHPQLFMSNQQSSYPQQQQQQQKPIIDPRQSIPSIRHLLNDCNSVDTSVETIIIGDEGREAPLLQVVDARQAPGLGLPTGGLMIDTSTHRSSLSSSSLGFIRRISDSDSDAASSTASSARDFTPGELPPLTTTSSSTTITPNIYSSTTKEYPFYTASRPTPTHNYPSSLSVDYGNNNLYSRVPSSSMPIPPNPSTRISSYAISQQPSGSSRAPISRTTKACNACRSRKVRCDAGGAGHGGQEKPCSRCKDSSLPCEYSQIQRKRGPMPGGARMGGKKRAVVLGDPSTISYNTGGGGGGGGGGGQAMSRSHPYANSRGSESAASYASTTGSMDMSGGGSREGSQVRSYSQPEIFGRQTSFGQQDIMQQQQQQQQQSNTNGWQGQPPFSAEQYRPQPQQQQMTYPSTQYPSTAPINNLTFPSRYTPSYTSAYTHQTPMYYPTQIDPLSQPQPAVQQHSLGFSRAPSSSSLYPPPQSTSSCYQNNNGMMMSRTPSFEPIPSSTQQRSVSLSVTSGLGLGLGMSGGLMNKVDTTLSSFSLSGRGSLAGLD